MISASVFYVGVSSGASGAIAGAATDGFGVVGTFWFVVVAACDAFGDGDCHPLL